MKILRFGGKYIRTAVNFFQLIDLIQKKSQEEEIIIVLSGINEIEEKLDKAIDLASQKDLAYEMIFEDIKSIHLQVLENMSSKKHKSVFDTLETKLLDLKNLLKTIYKNQSFKENEYSKLMSYGPYLATFILSESLKRKGVENEFVHAKELIFTNNNYVKPKIDKPKTLKTIQSKIKKASSKILVIPGNMAMNKNGETVWLGKMGTNLSAIAMGVGSKAKSIEFWIDKPGLFAVNPLLLKNTTSIEHLTYDEAKLYANYNPNSLDPTNLEWMQFGEIPVYIKSFTHPHKTGTEISSNKPHEEKLCKSIVGQKNIHILQFELGPQAIRNQVKTKLFQFFASKDLATLLMNQSINYRSFMVGLKSDFDDLLFQSLKSCFKEEFKSKEILHINWIKDLSLVALIGEKLNSKHNIKTQIFQALSKNYINAKQVIQDYAGQNITLLLPQADYMKGINALYESFFDKVMKQLHLFMMGTGNIGEKLIDEINYQNTYLKNQFQHLKLVGLANSKKMIFNHNGIDLENWPHELQMGEKSDLQGFFDLVKKCNLRNSIFIDVTASEKITHSYSQYLSQNIAVIACSKFACSGDIDLYNTIRGLSESQQVPFLYGSNVCAGLPVLSTLKHLINTGDQVTKIEAVLSGSLNFVFNKFSDKTNFHDTVKQAQFEGYTEPDPREDFSGIDVARKVLILARECGIPMHLEDVQINSFLKEDALTSNSIDDFYEILIRDEDYFQNLYQKAVQNNSRLKYVAEFKNGKATIELREVSEEHPFYHLTRKDNLVMFYTNRYKKQPLIIQGAGSGVDNTALALISEIIQVSNS